MRDNLQRQGPFTLPPSGRLVMPFLIDAALNSLPAFCASEHQASLLDPLREFLRDGNYQLIIRACPSTQQQSASNTIAASQTYEDQISVPAGSFLIMVGGRSDSTAGFRTKWYDAGAQDGLSDAYMNGANCSGLFQPTPATAPGMLTNITIPKNIFILPSPLTITSPGQLNVQITNLATESATIEMAFYFATHIGHFDSVQASIIGNSTGR